MSKVSKLNQGYRGFFKKMSEFSYSPYSSTFDGIYKCVVPHSMSAANEVGGGFRAVAITLALSPILLPLTLVTSAIALVLVIAAALTTAFSYPVAAIIDHVEDQQGPPALTDLLR